MMLWAGHVTRTKTTEGQALWQPGGAEEDSRFRESNWHLCLTYGEEEEDCINELKSDNLLFIFAVIRFSFEEPNHV